MWAFPYAFEPQKKRRELWYDRWSYEVINAFVEAGCQMGCEPLIQDIDTFIDRLCEQHSDISFAVNLNSGATPLQNLGLLPTLCGWFDIPCFPNSSDVLMIGERKDVAKNLASNLFQTPSEIDFTSDEEWPILAKPIDMGNSRGVNLLNSTDQLSALLKKIDPQSMLFEQFIPGTDVTIPV